MNNAFLTKLAQTSTEAVTKGGTGSRTSAHDGDAYTNKQGRIFGLSDKHNAYFDIEKGVLEDGTYFIKVKAATSNGTDKKTGKPTYPKTSFKTSDVSTGTPFITVTKLCKELFGKDKENWARDFQKQGEQDGYTFYTVMELKEETSDNAKADKKDTKKTK